MEKSEKEVAEGKSQLGNNKWIIFHLPGFAVSPPLFQLSSTTTINLKKHPDLKRRLSMPYRYVA